MFSKKIDRKLLLSMFLFLLLGLLYKLAFSPIYYINGIKFFNNLYTQGDVNTYIAFSSREIQGHAFLEWFLKLNSNNISLVYFSWFHSVLNELISYELVLTSLLVVAIYFLMDNILKFARCGSLFSSLSLLLSFPILIHMQTYTKEILALLFLLVSLSGVAKKEKKLVILGLFFLAILRVYFALIFVFSLIMMVVYKKTSKKTFALVLLFFLLFCPLLYLKVFPQFLALRGLHSAGGIVEYYLLSMKSFGLLMIWLPFKIFENFFEPFYAVYNTTAPNLIFKVASILDMLSSSAMLLFLSLLWFLRKHAKKDDNLGTFLLIFSIMYMAVIGSMPIVHFRYFVLLLPVLGILLDLLNAANLRSK